MRRVVIYPGRFQPMLGHHIDVYRQLEASFPQADVYFGTSNKVEMPKSPFNFKQKQAIAQAHGVNPKRILQASSPYKPTSYQRFDERNTALVFAVGEKDAHERFPFNNVDPRSGLHLKRNGEPAYFQRLESSRSGVMPMSERAYIAVVPNIMRGNTVASANDFREAVLKSPDRESAKKIFLKQFGQYNESVFNIIYDNIVGSHFMTNENLNYMRKLAGLNEAPVDFTDINPSDVSDALTRPAKALKSSPKKASFFEPQGSNIKRSVANRFPTDVDVNDPEIKKQVFMQELAESPVSLLGEINARLATDDNSLSCSDRLSDIMHKLDEMGILQLPVEEKKFVYEIVNNAINNMQIVRDPRNSARDAGDLEIESLTFDDLREEYEIVNENDDLRDLRDKYQAIAASIPDYRDLDKLAYSWMSDDTASMCNSLEYKMKVLDVWKDGVEAAGSEDKLRSAIAAEAEFISDRYSGSGHGIGSSDMNSYVVSILKGVGVQDPLGWDAEYDATKPWTAT